MVIRVGASRHARIDRGRIGLPAFRVLLTHSGVAGLPLLLETPGGEDEYAEDLAVLKGSRP